MATSKITHYEAPRDARLGTFQNIHVCTRCSGLLIREGLFDLLDDTEQRRRWARRCVQCGDIVDSLILKHRMSTEPSSLKRLNRRRWPTLNAPVVVNSERKLSQP